MKINSQTSQKTAKTFNNLLTKPISNLKFTKKKDYNTRVESKSYTYIKKFLLNRSYIKTKRKF